MISKGYTGLSLKTPFEILNIHRSLIYYKHKPESELKLGLMRQMEEHYLHHPYKCPACKPS